MPAPILDPLPGLRSAVLGDAAIAAKHADYQGSKAIFTRRPVPADAGYIMTVISEVTVTDQDGISDYRPIGVYDISTYGEQPGQYRDTEWVARAIRALFHRNRMAFTVPGYSVTQIIASGPTPAPADDENHAGRRVTLTIEFYAKG